jgi:hypothetical protein
MRDTIRRWHVGKLVMVWVMSAGLLLLSVAIGAEVSDRPATQFEWNWDEVNNYDCERVSVWTITTPNRPALEYTREQYRRQHDTSYRARPIDSVRSQPAGLVKECEDIQDYLIIQRYSFLFLIPILGFFILPFFVSWIWFGGRDRDPGKD